MGLPSLRDTIARYGLAAKKSLGQHFLLDPNICAKIAQAAGDLSGCTAIEIGPGPGGLTRALLEAGAKHVLAVEMDTRCVEALQALVQVSGGRLQVLQADAMKIQVPELCAAPRKIVANLPYNVGTPLLVGWLHEIAADVAAYESLTLMFQQEVVERIAAAPDSKEYGRLSVLSQWLCDVRLQFTLPPGAFSPPPKVYSAVVTLTPRAQPLYSAQKAVLEKVTAAGFGQRRKMLRSALKSLTSQSEALLEAAGIDGTRRAETLTIQEWCLLSEAYRKLQ